MIEKILAMRGLSGGGASSWNDLKDKPFGTEVTETYGDTITWDGNTDGRLICARGNLVKISDAIVTAEELKNGYKLCGKNANTGIYEEKDFVLSEDADYYEGAINICGGTVFCVYSDGFELMGETVPEKGVYMIAVAANFAPYSLTIPNYTGVKTVTETITKLDIKYLPIEELKAALGI